MPSRSFVSALSGKIRPFPRPAANAPVVLPVADVTVRADESVRSIALDAFRGLNIGVMLLVNNAVLASNTPRDMVHAAFGQMPTLADMVFPWFLLAVGIAIPFSAASARAKGVTGWRDAWQTVRRVLLLYGVGILVDSCVRRHLYLGTGVLQLIALVSGVARLLYLPNRPARLILIAFLLIGYEFALTSLPVAGFEPGPFTDTHNLSKHFNDRFFHQRGLSGLLSVVPTTALALIGTLIGDMLRGQRRDTSFNVGVVFGIGTALTAIGLFWGTVGALMNKQFWTPSYICYAGGLGLLTLGVFYYLSDVISVKNASLRTLLMPFVIFGMNPLVAYAGAILFKTLLMKTVMITVAGKEVTLQTAWFNYLVANQGPIIGGWLYMTIYVLVVWLFCYYLYTRKISVRV